MVSDTASLKEMGDSQFAPFLDEIIDTNDLPLPTDQTVQGDELSKWNKHHSGGEPSLGGPNHILQEMTIVRSRIGFDEQAFRDKCQKIQAELCQEFKAIVDEIYDALEKVVSDYSKQMYQIQVDAFKDFEGTLSNIRRTAVQTATIEQSLHNFINIIQQAYKVSFDN